MLTETTDSVPEPQNDRVESVWDRLFYDGVQRIVLSRCDCDWDQMRVQHGNRIGCPHRRFLRDVRAFPKSCWTFVRLGLNGYGRLNVSGRRVQAHRWAYELFFGPVATELVMDHLCRNTACVNPGHLEPVTPHENIVRGMGPAVHRAKKTTHCPRGHERGNRGKTGGCEPCRREARAIARAEGRRVS